MSLWYKLGPNKELIQVIQPEPGFFQSPERVVGKDKVGDTEISTVFLGLDHRMLPMQGDPVVFETMTFSDTLDEQCVRYCTWDEAEKGHKEMVDYVKKVKGSPLKDTSRKYFQPTRKGVKMR